MTDLATPPVCSVAGCDRRLCAKGLCRKHYLRAWSAENPERQREYTKRSYARVRARRIAEAASRPPKEPRVCSVDGCNRKLHGKGLCSAHWQRMKATGELRPEVPIGTKLTDDELREKASERARLWASANREKSREIKRAYALRNVERERERRRQRRQTQESRDAANARMRRWRLKNPSVVAVNNHKRRANRGNVAAAEYLALLQHDPCAYCGGPAGEIDHIDPIKAGGGLTEDNLTAACRSCNASKHTKPLLGYLADRRLTRDLAKAA